MTSLAECLHFNMKNILTWFSRKSHLNMLWFHMKLSHFDSPEPLSARIHLAFSFLQRGTCSVTIRIPKADDQELPSLWRTLWIRPRSINQKISDVMSNGKSTERRILSVLSNGILYTCFYSGALQAIQPCQPQSKKHMWPFHIEYTGRTFIPRAPAWPQQLRYAWPQLARCSPFYSWGTLDRWHPQDFLEHRFHGSCCVLPNLISKDLSLHHFFLDLMLSSWIFRSYVEFERSLGDYHLHFLTASGFRFQASLFTPWKRLAKKKGPHSEVLWSIFDQCCTICLSHSL